MTVLKNKDSRWLLLWISSIFAIGIWDVLFLNRPALQRVASGFVNTLSVAFLTVLFTLAFSWAATLILHYFEPRKFRAPYYIVTFLLNIIRSIPQIIGILFAYVGITLLIQNSIITSQPLIFVIMAIAISLFIMPEVADLMRDRIDRFMKLDFYNAMRVCGIPDRRVVNFNILWKNSRLYILNKLIAVFGYAVFLQCSVDFIISVGLSTDVNEVTLPATLGGLLASIDSKQDILAVGYTLTHPAYIGNLFFENLQGLTVAFLIVFSLFCVYNIANGWAERNRL